MGRRMMRHVLGLVLLLVVLCGCETTRTATLEPETPPAPPTSFVDMLPAELLDGVHLPFSPHGETPPESATVVVVTPSELSFQDAASERVSMPIEGGIVEMSALQRLSDVMHDPGWAITPLVLALRDSAAERVVVIADAEASLAMVHSTLLSIQMAGVPASPLLAVSSQRDAAGPDALRVLPFDDLGIRPWALANTRWLEPDPETVPAPTKAELDVRVTGAGAALVRDDALLPAPEGCPEESGLTLCRGLDRLELYNAVGAQRAAHGNIQPTRIAFSPDLSLSDALELWLLVRIAATPESPESLPDLATLDALLSDTAGTARARFGMWAGVSSPVELAPEESHDLKLDERLYSDLGLYGVGSGGGGQMAAEAGGRENGVVGERLIRAVIAQHQREIERCYEPARMVDPTLSGGIEVRFTIADNGRVSHTELQSDDVGDKVSSCILQRLKTWRFPQPRPGQNVTVTTSLASARE